MFLIDSLRVYNFALSLSLSLSTLSFSSLSLLLLVAKQKAHLFFVFVFQHLIDEGNRPSRPMLVDPYGREVGSRPNKRGKEMTRPQLLGPNLCRLFAVTSASGGIGTI